MKISGIKNMSLKHRIFVWFFSILLLMACSCFFVISRFITRFTETQLNNDYNDILSETCDNMENLLWNLTLTSGQILDNEDIQETLMCYQDTTSPYERQTYYTALMDSITMLTLANTDISLLYLYDNQEEDFIFNSFPVSRERRDQAPVLYKNTAFTFCGPCVSQSSYNGNPVLILNRTETLPNGRRVVLSIESGFYSLLAPMRSAERKSAYLAVADAGGELIYTTFPEDGNSRIREVVSGGTCKGYRSMSKTMSQGWAVHIIIPEHIYIQDYYQSLMDIVACTVVIAIFVSLAAVYFWKSIYSPLRLFDCQLESLLATEGDPVKMHSSIPEYDYLLQKIARMQQQIQEMIRRMVQQEKANTKMQIEKLRAQINPHFLLNTLNTLHWMALINEQNEIDSMTQALSHLLSYNLDKESTATNLEKELSALGEYVRLQKIRYDFQFRVERPHPEHELNYPCPKFLLQPLVENALSHGYRPGMEVLVKVQVDGAIHLTVCDTGMGMEAKELEKINKPASQSGIGLSYVISSLRELFSDAFRFAVSSEKGRGTAVEIEFPKLKGSGYHVKNSDYR